MSTISVRVRLVNCQL